MNTKPAERISLSDISSEPFRAMFPLAVLAGITGAAVWPLHFWGVLKLYPGQAHARIMAAGLLGGFILGFLGTAMPRMLSASKLGVRNVFAVALLHVSMVICYATGKLGWGDHLFAGMLLFFILLLVHRFLRREDIPPPGFTLVGLALLCATGAAIIGVAEFHVAELDPYWVQLRRLLLYQGFVLLPVLGIGPFLLPRFFNLKSLHDFPEMRLPSGAWVRKAMLAFSIGLLVVGSLFLEASGWFRVAHWLRFGAALVYLGIEFPFRRARGVGDALAVSLWIAFAFLVGGFVAIAIFPQFRVGLLHLSLIGGFAVIAFVVATRVIYGHSGNLELLKGRNRWLPISVSLMLLASATRASGDLWPAITISHYIYGALSWIAAALIWSWYVLPKVLQPDKD
jgi:hypothetical protein